MIRFRRRRARRAERRIGAALVLHQTGRVSSPDGRSVLITPTQHRLLEIFCGRPGEVIPRAQLRDLLYGEESECWERAIDVLVSRLRKRLASFGAADLISCYRGVGYRLEV